MQYACRKKRFDVKDKRKTVDCIDYWFFSEEKNPIGNFNENALLHAFAMYFNHEKHADDLFDVVHSHNQLYSMPCLLEGFASYVTELQVQTCKSLTSFRKMNRKPNWLCLQYIFHKFTFKTSALQSLVNGNHSKKKIMWKLFYLIGVSATNISSMNDSLIVSYFHHNCYYYRCQLIGTDIYL